MQTGEWFKSTLADWDERFLASPPFDCSPVGVEGVTGVRACAMIRVPDLVTPRRRETIATRPATSRPVCRLFQALLNNERVKSGQGSRKSIKLCISGAVRC